MFAYAWMGLGLIVSAVITWLMIKEIRRAIKASNRGEGSDYDFEID
jgi:hypothetical protein